MFYSQYLITVAFPNFECQKDYFNFILTQLKLDTIILAPFHNLKQYSIHFKAYNIPRENSYMCEIYFCYFIFLLLFKMYFKSFGILRNLHPCSSHSHITQNTDFPPWKIDKPICCKCRRTGKFNILQSFNKQFRFCLILATAKYCNYSLVTQLL